MFVIVPDRSIGDPFTETMWDTYIRDNFNMGVIRPIAEVMLESVAAQIAFTSIAADWMHLLFVLHGRSDTGATSTDARMRFNGDTGGNYDYEGLVGSAAGASASETFGATSLSLGNIAAGTAAANLFSGCFGLIPHYANAVHNKSVLSFLSLKIGTASGSMNIYYRGGAWRSNNAINQVTFLPAAGNFVAGSMVTLYGMGGI